MRRQILTIEGYHSNFFLATLRLESADANDKSGRPNHCQPLKHHVSWGIEPISEDWLLNHEQQYMPHIVIMGNSINGSYEDYMVASSPNSRTGRRHNEAGCHNNKEHIANFLVCDHDRLSLSFFARHRHYTFGLDQGQNGDILYEREMVSGHMDRIFPELSEQWRIS